MDQTAPTVSRPGTALYQHTKRPAWGLAVRVWDADQRSNYQFEDGKLRSIGAAFVHLLREVDRPLAEAEQLQAELSALAGIKIARKKDRERGPNAGRPLISLDQQIRLFESDHPGAFANESWLKTVRGAGAPRRAKGHRDAAILDAQAAFGREDVLAMLADHRHGALIDRAIEVLSKTNLVTEKDLDPLRGLAEHDLRGAASALAELLYSEGSISVRMQGWITAASRSGHRASWQLATAIGALVHPRTEVWIRANVFSEQARWLVPRVKIATLPSGTLYARMLEMATTVFDELTARGLAPADLLDVHDFVWDTLRPAARTRIAALGDAPGEAPPQSYDDAEDKTPG